MSRLGDVELGLFFSGAACCLGGNALATGVTQGNPVASVLGVALWVAGVVLFKFSSRRLREGVNHER